MTRIKEMEKHFFFASRMARAVISRNVCDGFNPFRVGGSLDGESKGNENNIHGVAARMASFLANLGRSDGIRLGFGGVKVEGVVAFAAAFVETFVGTFVELDWKTGESTKVATKRERQR